MLPQNIHYKSIAENVLFLTPAQISPPTPNVSNLPLNCELGAPKVRYLGIGYKCLLNKSYASTLNPTGWNLPSNSFNGPQQNPAPPSNFFLLANECLRLRDNSGMNRGLIDSLAFLPSESTLNPCRSSRVASNREYIEKEAFTPCQ